jgi:hypothetical protein
VATYNHFFRKEEVSLGHPWADWPLKQGKTN